MEKSDKKPRKRPTPFELAFAAKEGKVKPEDLKGASKVLFDQHAKETLRKYLPGKRMPSNKKAFKPFMRLNQVKSH